MNRAIRRVRRVVLPLDSFLKKVPGVVHIGANTGQESQHYGQLGLNVLWFEPIPSVFDELVKNVAKFPKQRACRYLLAAESDVEYTLHVANNGGASSSILDFSLHKKIWPEVEYTHDIVVRSSTLADVISVERIDLSQYRAIVLDTQGSELLVLKGAAPVLNSFDYVKTEVADFESYAGCCQLEEMTQFMREHQFKLSRKIPVATLDGIGSYYDALYTRR